MGSEIISRYYPDTLALENRKRLSEQLAHGKVARNLTEIIDMGHDRSCSAFSYYTGITLHALGAE